MSAKRGRVMIQVKVVRVFHHDPGESFDCKNGKRSRVCSWTVIFVSLQRIAAFSFLFRIRECRQDNAEDLTVRALGGVPIVLHEVKRSNVLQAAVGLRFFLNNGIQMRFKN